jgi:hypothetical protein
MSQIVFVGICVVAIGAITWGTGRLIDVLRSRDRVNERLQIDDC